VKSGSRRVAEGIEWDRKEWGVMSKWRADEGERERGERERGGGAKEREVAAVDKAEIEKLKQQQ